MEKQEIFKNKLIVLKQGLESFKKLLEIDITSLDEVMSDGILNGRIQKFEYCFEMLWKVLRKYLDVYDGIEVSPPKTAIKEFYLTGNLNSEEYETLFKMLEDRNSMSHIYDEEHFKEIHAMLPEYISLMEKIVLGISSASP